MKKIVLLLCLSVLGVGAYAQNYYFLLPNTQEKLKSKVDRVTDYKKFDDYYFNYALKSMPRNKKSMPRNVAKRCLELTQEYRLNAYALSSLGEEILMYWNKYQKDLAELRNKYPLTHEEEIIFQEYENRPTTRTNMLKNLNTFRAYEKLVLDATLEELQTQQAKAYLNQVYLFRAAVGNMVSNSQENYAQMRRVLDKDGKFADVADNMTDAERALIEEYLQMPVSLNGQAYTIPVGQYFMDYRSKLPQKQKRQYPTVHYK